MRIASKATKGKGKRWKRGMSSSCNPSSNRHRSIARALSATDSRPGAQPLSLTKDLIDRHNTIQSRKACFLTNKGVKSINELSDDNKSEYESIGGESFATVWTNCSNVSFNRLLLGFEPSSAMHKQMLSVLAAITEAIHSSGGHETETEYFAALMTCLESVDSEETLTAIISLTQMVLKRLSPNIMRLKFSETSKVFVEYLGKYVNRENGSLIRSLTNCIAILLQNQEYAVWELSSTQHIFETILSLTIHNKPRIRKTAHKSVARIIRSDINQSKSSLCHPIAKLTADFCIRKMQENDVNDNINLTLYILNLMNDILQVLPNASLKKSCETMLTLMTRGNILVVSASFRAFYTLFAAKPHDQLLTPELNAKIISALYDFQPNINDSQPMCAWSSAMKEAFINLHRIDSNLCFNHLPKLFNISVSCFLSDSKEVHLCLSNNLKAVYTDCIESNASVIDKGIFAKIYCNLENGLKYQYYNSWFYIIGLFKHMMNASSPDCITEIINKLVVIREGYDCVYASDIDDTIGRAIKIFGPKLITDLCPLKLNEENSDLSHNWLLPILRDNIEGTELLFFIKQFVPLASELYKSGKEWESIENHTNAKTCSILVEQIWSLLPSFCLKPTDFSQSFKMIAQNLGSLLSENVLLRGFILTAFKNLSKGFNNESISKCLSGFSKNYIPILFNIYTSEPNSEIEKNQRFIVYDVIQIFLSISEKALLLSLYTNAKERLNDSPNGSFIKHALMDLIRGFITYLKMNELRDIYSTLIIPYLNDNKLKTEQKKSFRMIEEICKSDSDDCLTFLRENLSQIIKLINESLSKCLPPSKSHALRSIKMIIEKELNNDSIDWENVLKELIAKVLDALMINTQKIKSSALNLLICISNAFKLSNDGKVDYFFEMMVTFLKKNKYSSTALIKALKHLYSESGNELLKHTECDLVETVINCIGSNDRQTIQASIDFLKCFFKSANTDQLSVYLELIITNISQISPQHSNHFRVKIKEIFVRLVRKYGYVMISKMIPESYKKVLKNIRKVEERKKKNNQKDESDNESKAKRGHEVEDILADSSGDELVENEDEVKTVSRKTQSWIKENEDDEEILDLLSNQLSQSILSKKPETKRCQTNEIFAMSEDGKIVIQDLDNKRGVKREQNDDSDQDMDQSVDQQSEDMSTKQSVKSKQSYQTGGKGIHRTVNDNRRVGEEYKSSKAKGDMKRKGKPDPYAYIPLNRQTLNRRKKSKLSGQFNNIVKAAKKGADMGSNKRFKKLRK